MDSTQMRARCPQSDLDWFIAEAIGWDLCFPRMSARRKGGVGSIVKSADTSVWGVVFAVSEEDLVRLDSFEGVPQSYTRDGLEVTTQNGTAREVWSYFAVSQGREFAPHSEYLALYLSGAQHFGLPPNYIEKLRRIRTADNA